VCTSKHNCDTSMLTEGEHRGSLPWAATSCRGWRPTMEDHHAAAVDFQEGISFFGVFDGHGGDRVAQHVSTNLLALMTRDPLWPQSPAGYDADTLTGCLTRASVAIDQAMHDLKMGARPGEPWRMDRSGSTGVFALVTQALVLVANVGDSRAIVVQVEKTHPTCKALSVDHTPSLGRERARVLASGGMVARGRVNGTLAVSRAFGDFG